MPNHFYVDTNLGSSGRLGSGDDTPYTSAQSGTMASLTAANTYETIGDAIETIGKTNPPVDGDILYVADNHNLAYNRGSNFDVFSGGLTAGNGGLMISVDTLDITKYKPGASEELNDGADDILYRASMRVCGVSFTTDDDTVLATINSRDLYFQDLALLSDVGLDYPIKILVDGVKLTLVNVDLGTTNPTTSLSALININGGSRAHWRGGAAVSAGGDIDYLVAWGTGGGGDLIVDGVDLSAIKTRLINSNPETVDTFLLRLSRCIIDPNVVLHPEFILVGHRFEMFNCDDTTGNSFHRFYIADAAGSAENNDAKYVTDTLGWDESTDKSSVQVKTTTRCTQAKPFIFDLPVEYIDVSAAASDKLIINLAATTGAIESGDIAAFAVYRDGSVAMQVNWISSAGHAGKVDNGGGNSPMAGDSAVLTNTNGLVIGDWTGTMTGLSPYTLELDTSVDVGKQGIVAIRFEIYRDFTTATEALYIDPEIQAV